MTFIKETEAREYDVPDEGLHRAQVIDVVEKDNVPNPWDADKPRDTVKLVWLLEDGSIVWGRDWKRTISLKPKKSNLRAAAEALGVEVNGGLDTEDLVGLVAMVNITHKQGDSVTFANVDQIIRDRDKAPFTAQPKTPYVRVKDRLPF